IVLAAAAALFGEKRMLRVEPADAADDLLLGGAVDLGDEVVAPLGGDGERLQAVQAPYDELAGAARGPHGDIEKRLHGPYARVTIGGQASVTDGLSRHSH